MWEYINGYVTSGRYFVYKGVRYGAYTVVQFSDEFLKRNGDLRTTWHPRRGHRKLQSIVEKDGKLEWRFGDILIENRYYDVDPDKDIEKIVTPVWYLTPKEMVKKHLDDGTWIDYLWPQTLFYIFCLLASLITYQWYLVWIMGTYIYLRTSYITLSKGVLNRGW